MICIKDNLYLFSFLPSTTKSTYSFPHYLFVYIKDATFQIKKSWRKRRLIDSISADYRWSSRKVWLLTTTLGFFPLSSSLLKKEGIRKGEWIAKFVIKVMPFCSIRLGCCSVGTQSQQSSQTFCLPFNHPFSIKVTLYLFTFSSYKEFIKHKS